MPHRLLMSVARISMASVLLSAGLAHASMRATYELFLSADGNTHSIRTAETLAVDQTITQVLGEFAVELSPVVKENGDYTLRVIVTPIPEGASRIAPGVSLSFLGALNGPLEFTGQFGESRLSGALMLRQLQE